MSFWQKCVVVLLAIAIFGGAGYFAHVAFRPVELARLQSIPWVKYVHPNVKRLKQAQDSVREGKLNEAREILVKALVLEPKSPVTRELRDLLGNVDTQIFFSKEPSPRKTEYLVKQGDALSSIARNLDSSAEAIMRVNNLDSALIRPGGNYWCRGSISPSRLTFQTTAWLCTMTVGFLPNIRLSPHSCRRREGQRLRRK